LVRGGPVPARRELGAWVRVTVNELLSLPFGAEPVPQIVDAQTYLTLVTAANALGELVAALCRLGPGRCACRRSRRSR
jgi:hypothetical protein